MSDVVRQVQDLVNLFGMVLLPAIIQVLKTAMGVARFDEIATENVLNGSNDQKRLIMKVSQAYRNQQVKAPVLSAAAAAIFSSDDSDSSDSDSDSSDSDSDSSDSDSLKCIRCQTKSITTVNMPCGHECYCKRCAKYVVEHRSKCEECNTRIRHTRKISGRFQIECRACGFTWNGNAQHICSATEYTMIIGYDCREDFITAARGWDFFKVPDTISYKIALNDYYFDEMMTDLKQAGLFLQHQFQDTYTVQRTEPELFCERCDDELDYNFHNISTEDVICQGCQDDEEEEETERQEEEETRTCDRCGKVVGDRWAELIDTGDEPGNNKFCRECWPIVHPELYT